MRTPRLECAPVAFVDDDPAELGQSIHGVPGSSGPAPTSHASSGSSRASIVMLDMGDPVKIWDVACNMIRLAGLEPGRDIEVRETGLRPGEKLDEALLFEHEIHERTSHAKILCVQGSGVDPAKLLSEVENLTEMALRMDFRGIQTGLQRLVPEFRQSGEAERVSIRRFVRGRVGVGLHPMVRVRLVT